MKVMSELLAEAREKHYDDSIMVKNLRAMLQSTTVDNARMLRKQSTFRRQLAAETVPKARLHYFSSMRLTVGVSHAVTRGAEVRARGEAGGS